MTLKAIVDSIEGLGDDVKKLYVKDEASGKYNLDVEGMVSKDKLDEFRNNNISITQQLKQFTDLGIDIEGIKKAQAIEQQLKEKKLIDAGDIDGVVAERVKSLRTDYDTQVTDLSSKLTGSNAKLAILMIDNEVRKAATKSGVLSTAVDDVLLRARSIFSIKDGNVVAEQDGKPVYGKDGTSTMSVDEYVTTLGKLAPHLFASSEGSGRNSGQRTGSGKINSDGLSANQKIAKGLQERA